MKQVALNVKTREAIGSTAVKRLRAEGQIPAVIYGENGVRHLQIDAHAYAMAWRKIGGSAALIELHADGAEESTFAIVKDAQRDPRKDNWLHVDFLEVVRGKDMEAEIPVHAKGSAFGVRNQQGVLEINAQELLVRCRPRHLPEEIAVDVAALKVGDSLHVRDLPVIEGVTFIDDADLVVVSCVGASGGKSGDEESAEAEPEVEAEPAKAAAK